MGIKGVVVPVTCRCFPPPPHFNMSSSPASIITSDPSLKCFLPNNFLIGCASASYQIEGCTRAGGKGEGLWDTLLADKKGDNGEDACNSYEDWETDLDLVEKYGGNCYRFSIAWPRIIPKGESSWMQMARS